MGTRDLKPRHTPVGRMRAGGEYVVPDALDLVSIDREQDRGTYAETNLWMRHS